MFSRLVFSSIAAVGLALESCRRIQSSSQERPASSSARHFFNLNESDRPYSQVDLAGSSEQGTLVFYRQRHRSTLSQLGDSADQNTLMAQWEMLKALERHRLPVIFDEGLSRAMNWTQSRQALLEQSDPVSHTKILRFLDSPSLSHMPSPEELQFVGLFGAAWVYGARHSEVQRLPVMTPEESQINHQKIQEYRNCVESQELSPEACRARHQDFIHVVREGWAVRELRNYFLNHPGAFVGLVYGAKHQFCDNFQSGNLHPQIYSLWTAFSDSSRIPGPCLN